MTGRRIKEGGSFKKYSFIRNVSCMFNDIQNTKCIREKEKEEERCTVTFKAIGV